MAAATELSRKRYLTRAGFSCSKVTKRPTCLHLIFCFAVNVSSASFSAARLSKLSTQYDAIILDQFGVLHDGQRALPGAVHCFDKLVASKKAVLVLSNASRRRSAAVSKLARLGFDVSALSGFVTSGEEAYQYMSNEMRGKKAVWFTWEQGYNNFSDDYTSGLDLKFTNAEEADFVLCQGSQLVLQDDGATPIELMRSGRFCAVAEKVLEASISRDLPMICANPDLYLAMPDGKRGYMPGLLARKYEELGGRVRYFGKPHTAAFDACMRVIGSGVPRSRVLHVGDSLIHDIAGANKAGVDTLFIAGGIHADEIGVTPAHIAGDEQISLQALHHMYQEYDAKPTHVACSFKW